MEELNYFYITQFLFNNRKKNKIYKKKYFLEMHTAYRHLKKQFFEN